MSVLEIAGVTKRFGSLVANDDVSLSLGKGEVLALLGENGAGKTTLMNILFGHYVADEGRIAVNGETLPPGSTDAAIASGVGMVHQHFTLADNMTVLENIMVGTERLWSLKSDTGAARARLAAMSAEFGLEVAPERRVGDLSVGERQRVEILKALYRDASILILDEPTAVLTPQEVDQLFEILKSMVAKGLSIVFISHKLHEILRISDRVAVLRRGRLVGEIATSEADRDILAEMMVGRKVERPAVDRLPPGAPVVALDRVTVADKGGGRPLLDAVSLTVHAHEIVGIAGVAGNGQSTLTGLLSGLQAPNSGEVRFEGAPVARFAPRDFIAMGMGRIPEDRHARGVVGELSLWENLISEDLRRPPFWRFGRLIDFAACRSFAAELIERFDIRARGMEMPTKLLSGGNMQKLILARTLRRHPKFILANQPVRGLDEGAIAFVHEKLLEAKRAGAGILLVSEDLDELLALSDRILVIYQGRVSRAADTRSVSLREIGVMMSGALDQAPAVQEAGA